MQIRYMIFSVCLVFLVPTDHFGQEAEWQWVERGGGSGSWNPPSSGPDDEVAAIELDKNGNVYVCGRIFASAVANFSGEAAHVRGYTDGFVAKYDCEGNLLWHIIAGGQSADQLRDLILDSLGDIYITGSLYAGTMTSDSAYIGDNAFHFYSQRAYVAKLDSNGNLVWVHIAYMSEGPGQGSSGISLDIDEDQNLYVTGFTFVDSGEYAPGHPLKWGNYLAKYSSSGNLFWVKQMASYPNPLVIEDLAVDDQGNCYIGGTLRDTITLGGNQFNPANQSGESIILEYDSSGMFSWGHISQSGNFSTGYRIQVDKSSGASNTFYIVGNTTDGASFGSLSFPNLNMGSFGFIVKYKNRIPIWHQYIDGQYPTGISAVTVDVYGDVYAASEIIGNNISIGGMKVKGKGGDPFVAKFRSNGDTVYARNMSTNASGFPRALATGYNGNFYLGGSFSQNIRLPGDTVWNVGGNTDMFIAKFGIEECMDTTTVDTTIGINEPAGSDNGPLLTVFPNPNNGNFSITTGITGLAVVSVYNTLGILIHEESMEFIGGNQVIEMEDVLPVGVYVLVVSGMNGTGHQRFVVKR